ncbi:MAG: flagellar hook basal-body protein [Fluviicoccus sp.]|uniref:flagellar hook-basal body protein n=1 Tax=Fluviicoccus sp. TaxID=2003552 RepID=UPI002722A5F5|nr:flagellar hook basal-body protein [Fluviicoccus sp.]MDO8330478.1 flagellar hook basal-body protein [Fluviicoccus sp.]
MQLASVIQREVDSVGGIAQNAANTGTPGYKTQTSFTRLVQSQASDPWRDSLGKTSLHTSNNLRDGSLKNTGVTTDLALSGDGWFVVSSGHQSWITRDGRFSVDPAGVLRTAGGLTVMGEHGPLTTGTNGFKVGNDGEVVADGHLIDRLKLIRVVDDGVLVSAGNGLYDLPGNASPPLKALVHQGMLENSNVQVSADMVRLMEATRHIETMQRALQAYDAVLNSGINQIGKE